MFGTFTVSVLELRPLRSRSPDSITRLRVFILLPNEAVVCHVCVPNPTETGQWASFLESDVKNTVAAGQEAEKTSIVPGSSSWLGGCSLSRGVLLRALGKNLSPPTSLHRLKVEQQLKDESLNSFTSPVSPFWDNQMEELINAVIKFPPRSLLCHLAPPGPGPVCDFKLLTEGLCPAPLARTIRPACPRRFDSSDIWEEI